MISIYGLIGAIIGLLLARNVWTIFLGYFVGTFIENAIRGQQGNGQRNSTIYSDNYARPDRLSQNQFSKALLILSAEVMRADGKILKAELEFVKEFFVHQFSRKAAAQYVLQLKDILNQQHNINKVCSDLNQFMPLQQRTVLVQYLFGIAQSDGNVSKVEINVIERIAVMLRIPAHEFEQLKSMFVESVASNEEIKKAYRKMAVTHHPDKYAQMGEEHQKAANEKFQKIQEAYETIKQERGL
jgi:DnaJ like chaperone protein